MSKLSKSSKINVLNRAAAGIADGTQEFSCNAVHYHTKDQKEHLCNWYSELSARLAEKDRPYLFVRDFTPYHYEDAVAMERTKNERLMWLAMLATLVENDIEKTL